MFNPLNFLSKIIKSNNQKELDKLKKAAKKINDWEEKIVKLDDQSFPVKAFAFLVLINKALIFFLFIFKFHLIFSEINFD